MSTPNSTRMHHQINHDKRGDPSKAGLLKLLAAAVLILAVVLGLMEAFGSAESQFVARKPQQETIVQ